MTANLDAAATKWRRFSRDENIGYAVDGRLEHPVILRIRQHGSPQIREANGLDDTRNCIQEIEELEPLPRVE